MSGKGTDKELNITEEQLLEDAGFFSEEFNAGMIELRQDDSINEITELYRLTSELNETEQKILEDAGFFTEEFKACIIELRQHYSLDEIIELYRLAGEIKNGGGDPAALLLDSLR